MNRAVPLSQFMPYGAPDLIAAGRTHMSRAVMTSSGLAVAAFLLAVAIAPLVPKAVKKAVPVPPSFQFRTEPILPEPKVPPATRQPIAPPKGTPWQGEIRPVDEYIEPVRTDLPPIFGDPDGKRGVVDPAPDVPAPPGDDPLPDRGVWIYTDQLPVAVHEEKPIYPEIAKEAGVEGVVVVYACVGKDGRVIKTEVDAKHSSPLLDPAAVEAARQWVFTPALANNHPVVVWVRLTFRFTLH
jgi:protein TonB